MPSRDFRPSVPCLQPGERRHIPVWDDQFCLPPPAVVCCKLQGVRGAPLIGLIGPAPASSRGTAHAGSDDGAPSLWWDVGCAGGMLGSDSRGFGPAHSGLQTNRIFIQSFILNFRYLDRGKHTVVIKSDVLITSYGEVGTG